MAATEPTSIDRTHPGVFCKVHGDGSPATYLGRERYGCWHCNPTRPVLHRDVPIIDSDPRVEPDWEAGDLPTWMLGEAS